MKELRVRSRKKVEAIDVTPEVERAVEESGVEEGIAIVFVPHTTAALVVNEFEPGLKRDLEKFFAGIAQGEWAHDNVDGNAYAHLVNSLVGSSKQFIVDDGKLVLGTWQNIILLELDGPRERRVLVKTVKK